MTLNNSWKNDYSNYRVEYESFQNEAKIFVDEIANKHPDTIDVANVASRLSIKSIKKLEENNEAGEYRDYEDIFNVKDIAGVRITCHCEDDVESLTTALEGELRQKYSNVDTKEIGGKGGEYPYRAKHITFSKTVKLYDNKSIDIFCEIQIRTVMADAWSVQNHRYIYKKSTEGEAHELTNAVSEIMNGCERLWSLVKKKSLQRTPQRTPPEVERIKSRIKDQVELVKRVIGQNVKNWSTSHREAAFEGLKKLEIKTFMEVQVKIVSSGFKFRKTQLRDAAQESTISTFGWPIGVFLGNRMEYKPVVDTEGIKAVISVERHDLDGSKTFDYWAIHTSGAFYTLKSIFEDLRSPKIISFNTRIVRITEVFMYLRNLYTKLEVGTGSYFEITIKHGGIKGRQLSTLSQNRLMFGDYIASADEVETTLTTSINQFNNDPFGIVEKFTEPLFENFDFFKLERKVLEEIVQNYLNGKVT